MFDEYAKKLESIGANVPKVFKAVASNGANFAEKKAVELTKKEKLVDTGYYRDNWFADRIEPEKGTYGIILENNVEYASYLENGYQRKGGGRFKGRFVGRQTMDETRYKCIQMLDKAWETAFRKYHESFTTPEE